MVEHRFFHPNGGNQVNFDGTNLNHLNQLSVTSGGDVTHVDMNLSR